MFVLYIILILKKARVIIMMGGLGLGAHLPSPAAAEAAVANSSCAAASSILGQSLIDRVPNPNQT